MNAKFKTVALSAVMMAGLMAASAASAQIVVGGGATLPQPLYAEILPLSFGVGNVSYTGTGSGAGLAAFLSNNPQKTVGKEFRNETLATRPIWATTQSVHFAGSDAVLSAADRTAYNTAHVGKPATDPAAWGRLIQLPAVGTPVLLPYKRAGVTALNLSDAQVCAIFGNKANAGQTWGQVLGTTDATPVSVIYRLESSGTTELLSNYLVAACNPLGYNFAVSPIFTTVVAGPVGAIPSNWQGFTGNPGVAGAFGVDGRIGYLSPDPAYNPADNTLVAQVNSSLPVAASIQAALATKALPTAGLTGPELVAAGDPLNWVPAYTKPASGYPIYGTTNLLVNQCYKDANVQAKVKTFLQGLYGTTYDSNVTAHRFVNLPATGTTTTNWKKAINDVFLSASHPLAIGNTNVCNGIGRPLQN